jgi:cyclophilin family peptidyl-prolyl cis-trans isomerase
MANSGPNTNGSQFFICLADQPSLPKQYNLFGQVISGMDVAEKIQVGDKINKITIENID